MTAGTVGIGPGSPAAAPEADTRRGAAWRRMAGRIDALNLRERVLILAAAAALLVALFHALLLGPALARQQQLSRQVARQQGQMAAMEAQARAFAGRRNADPNAAARGRLEQLRRQLGQIDGSLADLQKGLVSPENMASLLEDMLRRDGMPRLVALKTLPTSSLASEEDGKTQVKGAAPVVQPPSAAAAQHAVYKHGVELTLEGSYPDLLRYLTQLEALPWRMFWSKIEIKAEYPKVTMTLTLYTLSLDQTWLSI